MTVFIDNWEIDPNEATWLVRRRYNERSPFTVLQYSSSGHPLAIGGEGAANSVDLLKEAGITCRLCVAGPDTKWAAGQKPPPVAGVQDLEDFVWNRWCKGNVFSEINNFVSDVAFELRSQGVLVYCKKGANRSAAAAIAVIAYITGAPWEECERTARCARATVDISRSSRKFPTIVSHVPDRPLQGAVVLPELARRDEAKRN